MKLYSIGQLHKISRVPIDTLRYYDKINLLKPAHIDEDTGYRYYTQMQFWELELITICKNLFFPLKQISSILSEENDVEILPYIQNQKQHLLNIIDKYKSAIENLEWYEDEYYKLLESKKKLGQIFEQQLPERSIIYEPNTLTENDFFISLNQIASAELRSEESVKRKYGFILNIEAFKQKKCYIEGEFVTLFHTNYKRALKNHTTTLVEGKYVCMNQVFDPFSAKGIDISAICEYIEKMNYEPIMVIASEMGMSWIIKDTLVVQVQVLVKTKS